MREDDEECTPELELTSIKGPPSPVSVSSSVNYLFEQSEEGGRAASVLNRSIDDTGVSREEVREEWECRESKSNEAAIFLIGMMVAGVVCAYYCLGLVRAVS